ncbi:Hypothetical predicted protein [Paramuricea clavata]|uniref:Uncharacterized protein n=1 Tax=Paramuricea clavata TaxID=317549 RepID=A0A6S7G1T4_PARCT|nr:Hypothetical predicted protein [Paramuricea clavata]
MQTHFIIPEVKRYWEQMQDEIWDILSGEPVVLCGDGRNDSPGHSAKYCMYAFMEQHLDVIVDVEVVDKRQTGGISTNMEVFRNDAFVSRTYLAAIDHNAHVFRKAAVTASGKPKHNKVYSKRSKNWRVKVVKEPRTYDFWPTIACRILKKRVDDEESILQKVEIPKEHPKNIAQSIALKPIPKTSDLVEQSLSRFAASTPAQSHPTADAQNAGTT